MSPFAGFSMFMELLTTFPFLEHFFPLILLLTLTIPYDSGFFETGSQYVTHVASNLESSSLLKARISVRRHHAYYLDFLGVGITQNSVQLLIFGCLSGLTLF